MAKQPALLAELDRLDVPDTWHEIEDLAEKFRADARLQTLVSEPVDEALGRRLLVAATAFSVALVGLILLATVFGTDLLGRHRAGQGASGPTGTVVAPPGWLVDLAANMAAGNGDPNPTSAAWVKTDANAAAAAVGLNSGDPMKPVFLVVLHGDFTGYMAKVPAGASLPEGRVLAFTAPPDSRQVTDWGISDQEVRVPGLQPFSLQAAITDVPNVVGLKPRVARSVLRNSGLKVDIRVMTGTYTEAAVAQQDPAAGTRVDTGTTVTIVTGPAAEHEAPLDLGDVIFRGRTNGCRWTLYGEWWPGGAGGGLITLVSGNGDLLGQALVGTFTGAKPLELRSFVCNDPHPAMLVYGFIAPSAAEVEWITASSHTRGPRSALDCVPSNFPDDFCLVLEDFSSGVDVVAFDASGAQIDRASFDLTANDSSP